MFGGGSFYKLSVSKALLMICGSSSLAPLLVKEELKHIFTLNIDHLAHQSQLWRIVTSHLIIQDLHVLIIVLLLLFNFRIFERRYGSRKYASYLLATGIMGSFLNLSLMGAIYWWGYSPPIIQSGLVGVLGSLFVPFFLDVPNISVQASPGGNPLLHLLSGKTLIYLLGLQLAISSACAPSQFITGILAGCLYRANFLGVQSYIAVPKMIANLSSKLIGSLIESKPPPTNPYPQGATLDIQRMIKTDYIEQRWMLLQARQNRQGRVGQTRQFPPFNLFQRQQNRPLPPTPFQFFPRAEVNGNHPGGANPNLQRPFISSPLPPVSVVVSEEKVQQLVDMGFNSSNVRAALQASNNDISLATNILLQN